MGWHPSCSPLPSRCVRFSPQVFRQHIWIMLGAQDGHKPHTWTHIRASQRWGHLRGFMSLERGAESQTFSAYVTDFINTWTVENLLGETDCGLQRSQFNVWQLRPHSLLLTLSPAFRKKRLNSVQMHKTLSFRCFTESKRLCEHVFSLFSRRCQSWGDSGDMTAHPQSPEHPLCQETRDGFLREDKNNIWPAAHG